MVKPTHFFWAAACAAALICPANLNAACRQALALGLDVSGSVDAREYRLQLDGLATALNSTQVRDVLFANPAAPITLTVFEWSGPNDQTIILPWTSLANFDTLTQITHQLHQHTRNASNPTTAIGSALRTGFTLLNMQPDCWKRTLDISGDGPANTGPRPQDISPAQTPPGVTVNGLVIGGNTDIKELSTYYSAYVIRGPGAFVETARHFDDYAAAMERKLLRELQSISLSQN